MFLKSNYQRSSFRENYKKGKKIKLAKNLASDEVTGQGLSIAAVAEHDVRYPYGSSLGVE